MYQVGVLIFPAVEVLDFTGPFEALSAARDGAGRPCFSVHLIAPQRRPVEARHGLTVQPHFSISDHPALDLLLVPGGYGIRSMLQDEAVCTWLQRQANTVPLVGSICTGAWLLAHAGLLHGLPATTHQQGKEKLLQLDPTIQWREARFVDQGHRITAAGVSAGIDMALHLVVRFCGLEIARATAAFMEYPLKA